MIAVSATRPFNGTMWLDRPCCFASLPGVPSAQTRTTPQASIWLASSERKDDLVHPTTRLRAAREIERRSIQPSTGSHAAVYRLAEGVPVEKTIELLRQLVPDAKNDDRKTENPMYLESFGQAVLVCRSKAVHRRIEQLLGSLELCPRPPIEGGGMQGKSDPFNEQ